jgi:hypothetical protein
MSNYENIFMITLFIKSFYKYFDITTRCVMKHKCPRERQIPEVAIIVKTQGQDFKI